MTIFSMLGTVARTEDLMSYKKAHWSDVDFRPSGFASALSKGTKLVTAPNGLAEFEDGIFYG